MDCFYSFSFTKADGATGAGLPNAVFELHGMDGFVQSAVSDANGCVQFPVRLCRTYILIEQTPPPGYAPHFAPHRICIDACGQVFVNDTLSSSLTLLNFQITPLFSVTYLANGGIGGSTDSGLAQGSLYTVKTPTEAGISYPGFTFVGWNTAPDGSGTAYLPGSVIPISTDLMLYAQWTPVPLLSVSYNANGGIGGSVDSGLPAGTLYTVKTAAEAGVSFPGFTFVAWDTAPDGTGTVLSPGDVILLDADLTLYAIWEPIAVSSVIYDPNGGIGGSIDTGLTPGSLYIVKTPGEANVSLPGFDFIAWNTAPDGSGTTYLPGEVITVTSNLTLYAQWTPMLTFTVLYDANGGFGSFAETLAAGSLYTIKTPAEAGITFPGLDFIAWNTAPDGSGTTYLPGEVITITSNLTLYAQWSSLLTFTVLYDANGGFGSFAETLAAGSLYTIKTPAEVGITFPGFDFIAWNTAPDGSGATYLPGEVITITSNLTLYAQWIPLLTFTVLYDANGGFGSFAETLAAGSLYTIKTPAEVGIIFPEFDFIAWNTAPDGSGATYLPGEVITITSDLTLYAQWIPLLTFTVLYDANGGFGSFTETLTAGSVYTIKAPAEVGITHPTYTFIDWNTTLDGTGIAFIPGEIIIIDSNLTLYAQWSVPDL